MRASEMVGRKILFQWKDVERRVVTTCTVNEFEVEGDSPVFKLTSVTGHKFTAEVDKFNWEMNETELEFKVRNAQYLVKKWRKMYVEMSEEQIAKLTLVMEEDPLVLLEKDFEDKKAELMSVRIEKSKKQRQEYNDGELHVFYDIVNGNNVDSFMTIEEIERMKNRFSTPDHMRTNVTTELNHLQAFDEDGNLIIDEWDI